MNIDQIAAWFGGIVGIVTAISAMVVTVNNSINRSQDKIDTDKVLAQIHALVNSRLQEAMDEIQKLRNEIAVLRKGESK